MVDEAPPGGASNVIMMPWFLGGPWVPKFGDKEKQTGLADWRGQIETFIRAQNLNPAQQVDFVLSALQGEARREILLLPAGNRDSPTKIFKALEDVYGEQVSVVQLRARFFTCRQQAGEEVGAFILRLRECLARWRSKEEGPVDDSDDEMMRSQLVTGLRPGPLQTELQKLLRRNPTMKFAEVSREAKAVEQEQVHGSEEASTRRTYTSTSAPTAAKTAEDWQQIREKLKAEVLSEVKGQIDTLKESILGEIRQQFQASQPPQAPSDSRGARNRGRWETMNPPLRRRRERALRWDDQGRPICLHCDRPGHNTERVPTTTSPVPGFLTPSATVGQVAEEGTQTDTPLKPAFIGQCPEVEVTVHGKNIPCILDTGSQVTLFSQSLFQNYVQEPVHSAEEIPWLTLKAANGLNLPYIGYAILDFQIGGVIVPAKGVVIVKDDCLQSDYGILGMNVIKHCWEALLQDTHPGLTAFKSTIPRRAGQAWEKAFQVCRRVQATGPNTELQGTARLQPSEAILLPPQTEMVVWASVPQATGQLTCCVVVEDLGGEEREWRIGRSVVQLKAGKLPLLVCNPHPYPVELPHRKPIALVTQIDPNDVQGQKQLVLRPVGGCEVEVDVRPVSAEDDHDHPALSLQGEGLTEDQQEKLTDLLRKWTCVFAAHEEDYGRTSAVLHPIPTGEAPPVRERYRPVPPSLYSELRTLLQGMLASGIVTESSSPWAAPVVLVRKKDGSWRFCVDYRKLNAVTHKDSFPLPRIEESLTSLKKARWYSTLDLASGYWQVEVDPRDKEKTAFVTPMGLFQWERMPFGLCNAPATFQRLMQRCLGERVHDYLLIYLDDVIIYSLDFNSHLIHLEQVFERLHHHGLKLQPQKCRLFGQEVKYLGHVVSQKGVAVDPEKTAVVQDWPIPTTVKEVRAFLGFAGYYRRFVSGFSKIALPLNNLLQGTGGKKTAAITWTPACQGAFETLKGALLQAPILAYADFKAPFRLYTDASFQGLGAVLAQMQEGTERVIAYASRSLHPAERNDKNYSSFKLEFLALKWAVTEKFKDYLWGVPFKVFTDNRPLTHLQTANLGATEQRWMAQLANYTFELCYKPGSSHQNADALSRVPGAASSHLVGAHVLPQPSDGPDTRGPPEVDVPLADWPALQEADDDLGLIRQWKAEGKSRQQLDPQPLTSSGRRLLREWERLQLVDGVLVRASRDPVSGQSLTPAVVPARVQREMWASYHQAFGHARGQRMVQALRSRVFWDGMARDSGNWVAECRQCVLGHAGPEARAPLHPVICSGHSHKGSDGPDHCKNAMELNPDLPVYVIRPEGKEGPTRTIHRNNLRSCPGGWTGSSEVGEPGGVAAQEEVGFWPVNFQGNIRHPVPSQNQIGSSEPGHRIVQQGGEGSLLTSVGSTENGDTTLELRRSVRGNLGKPPARFGH
ncbi:uncharacterized protein LOC134062574 isoform X2 [Sardina pilchardus]|uniref:uncharacterized protein LOC134062574 isoform X2 n=2 Tax=Sardina pilchardus TaxID=27697 RepID=UPI002E12D847